MVFIIFGLIIRLLLIFSFSSFDINNHLSWSQDLVNRGFPGFYETISKEVYCCLYPNYPPLILYIFYPFFLLKNVIFNLGWWLNIHLSVFPSNIIFFLEKKEMVLGLMKLPAIIFDLGLFFLLFLFAKKITPKSKKNWLWVFYFILLNPVFIYLSSLWGQVESVNLFLIFTSVYLLLYSRQAMLSLLFFILALLIKPTALIFLPVYLIYFLKKFDMKKLLTSFLVGNVIFWLMFLPFYKSGNVLFFPYLTYWQKIISGQSMPFVTNSAFNFWSVFPFLSHVKDQSLFLNLFSYRVLGVLITIILYLFVILRNIKKIRQETTFSKVAFLTGFSFIMFFTRMHERYFIYLLPFLFLIVLKEKKYLIWLISCSIIFFLNVYYSWSVPYADFIGILKNNFTVSLISSLNVFLFFKLLLKMNG
ncbi:hypothetical protein HZA76_02265 [Candidatus Roizmanbacteria bacterium]|nr:hypothetical protein [Candidatus Roizmanbacteria bacterium]